MTDRIRAALADPALDQLFRTARTHNAWLSRPVPAALLRQIYELAKWGPTSANVSPGRFVFLTSETARSKLLPHLSSANRDKTLAAPVTVIVAHDTAFADKMPTLFPHNPGARAWFAEPAMAAETAFRNGSLQGAYLMIAARSLGLDCGPMSGFDREGVDRAFFPDSSWRTNFLCNLGYGSDENLFDRLPRLSFDEACQTL